MKKMMTLAALAVGLALTGAAYGTVSAEDPAPAPAPQPAAEQQKETPAQNAPFIIRRSRPLPKEQEAAKNPKPATPAPAVNSGKPIQDNSLNRPMKDWEKKYYEEHPEALKQDQDKNEPPEGKSRHNKDDDYYNWHRL